MKYKIAKGEFPELQPEQKYGAPRPDGRSHEGIDLHRADNKAFIILSELAGYIRKRLYNTTAGYSFWVYYNDKTAGMYVHVSKATYDKLYDGQRVEMGEQLGYSGSTGNATANVLHYEKHLANSGITDPLPYIALNYDMTKIKGELMLTTEKDTPIFDNNGAVVKRVRGNGKPNTFFAIKNDIVSNGKDQMFAISEKLDRWVHVIYVTDYALKIKDVDSAVQHIYAAQSELDQSLLKLTGTVK
jgi:hypothetical protein